MLQPISAKNPDIAATMPRVDLQVAVRTNLVMALSLGMRKKPRIAVMQGSWPQRGGEQQSACPMRAVQSKWVVSARGDVSGDAGQAVRDVVPLHKADGLQIPCPQSAAKFVKLLLEEPHLVVPHAIHERVPHTRGLKVKLIVAIAHRRVSDKRVDREMEFVVDLPELLEIA